MPKISVIVPVYNEKEEYFTQAIESVLSQSYHNFELLIIDDGSDPYIKAIVLSYNDKRIKYFRLENNSGAADARNYGIDHAEGEFIAFLDSDDISLKDRFQRQITFFESSPDIDCLGTGVKVIGEKAKGVNFKVFNSHEEIEKYLLFMGCVFCQSSVMLRKSILDDNNIRYKTEYAVAEDYALWCDLIGYAKFAILPEILTVYRFHINNTSHRQADLQRIRGVLVQLNSLKKHFSIQFKNKNAWIHFISGEPLTQEELKTLEIEIPLLVKKIGKIENSELDLYAAFKKKFRKVFFRTKTMRGQWMLCRSSLNNFFKISYSWRLFLLITRGILK